MRKKLRFALLSAAFLLICGCNKANEKEDGMSELSEFVQNQSVEKDIPDTQKNIRNAYFLDPETIFSAEVPENWHDEIAFFGGFSKAGIRFECIASEMEGFYEVNFFEIRIEEKTDRENYKEQKETEFLCMDGQKGKRYIWEYTDELMEDFHYHADVLVLPGENFLVRSCEIKDPYLTVARYEKNKEQIEAFYDSILYQEKAEQIGRDLEGALKERERIRVHLSNHFLKAEMVVPEGIFYETETEDSEFGGVKAEEFCLRLFLDEKKENYVEICSDLCGEIGENIVTQKGYQAEILDSGEIAYWYRWENSQPTWEGEKGGEYQQYWYTFQFAHQAGAKICVEKEKMELYELAHEIVRSIRFE